MADFKSVNGYSVKDEVARSQASNNLTAIQTLTNDVSDLKDLTSSHTNTINNIQENMTSVNQNVASVNESLNTTNGYLNAVQNNVNEMNETFTSVTGDITTLKEDNTTNKERLTTLETDNTTNKLDISTIQNEIKDLRAVTLYDSTEINIGDVTFLNGANPLDYEKIEVMVGSKNKSNLEVHTIYPKLMSKFTLAFYWTHYASDSTGLGFVTNNYELSATGFKYLNSCRMFKYTNETNLSHNNDNELSIYKVVGYKEV